MSENQPPRDRQSTDDEDSSRVADPEQYNQNQRLKEIHKARQNVIDALDDRPEVATSNKHQEARGHICRAVSAYVMELDPLMKRAEVDDELFELPDGHPFDDIFHYAYSLGVHPDNGEKVHDVYSMAVFRICNHFMAEVGLDADLDGGLPDDELQL